MAVNGDQLYCSCCVGTATRRDGQLVLVPALGLTLATYLAQFTCQYEFVH